MRQTVWLLFIASFFLLRSACFSQTAGAYIFAGDSCSDHEKYNEAISFYNKALALEPLNYDVLFSRAICYNSIKKYSAAIADYTKIINANQSLNLKISAHKNRGICYSSIKNFKAAIKDLSVYLEWFSENEFILSYRAYAFYSLNDFKKAISDYTELLKMKNIDSVEFHFDRSLCYYAADSMDPAVKDIERAIFLDPNDFRFYQHKWDLDYDLKKFNDVAIDQKNMQRIDSSFAYFDELEGISLYKQEKYTESVEIISRQIIKTPDNIRCYLYRELSYSKLKEYDKAILDANKQIELEPNSDAYNNRGWIYMLMKDYKRAMADLNKSLALDNNNINTYDSRGCVKYLLKDYAGAIADFNIAIRRNSEYANSHLYRGKCWLMLHNSAKACLDLNAALSLQGYTIFDGEKSCEDLITENCRK